MGGLRIGSAMKRLILFTIGFAIGAVMFVIGGASSQPDPPKCPRCVVSNATISNPQCTEAVQGGWTCQVH